MTIPQNRRMCDKYADRCKICTECKNLCSPQARRCMKCRVLRRFTGEEEKSIFITNDSDFKIRARKRIRELAIEQGWNLKQVGLE